ncbi:MAG: T9SS type A sorting domain-containing protein [Janthinobacterium lividum]
MLFATPRLLRAPAACRAASFTICLLALLLSLALPGHSQAPSVATILRPDGTLRAGASGSFDARGYQLSYGKRGQPVLRSTATNASAAGDWEALGEGPVGTQNGVNMYVAAVAVSGSTVYVGGGFTAAGGAVANHIAQWDGTQWSTLGTGPANGVSGEVRALVMSGSTLYVGGYFSQAGGVAASCVAKWDGTHWSALSAGGTTGIGSYVAPNFGVQALALSGRTLYVGGYFDRAGPVGANNVAQWDVVSSTWSTLGTGTANGVNGEVDALAVSGSTLYAGGNFTKAGGVAANSVARWDGTTWSSLGTGATNGVNSTVYALAVSGSTLYVGGYFTQAGGVAANSVARWDGTTWSSLGAGPTNSVPSVVYALAVNGSILYAEYALIPVYGSERQVTQWDGTSWRSLGTGVGLANVYNPYYCALVVSGSTLYAGGCFTLMDGRAVNRIARWDGTTWSSLGTGSVGVNYVVSALAVSGSTVYVGGQFTQVGGIAANRVARWDGTMWSSLGTGPANGVDGMVNALAVSGSTVYVGGNFTQAGGVVATSIAQWDGTNWHSLGTGPANGVNRGINALAVSGSTLYVGGNFTKAGGAAASYIAQWDGTSWRSLGAGTDNGVSGHLDGGVYALAMSGSTLYVGGRFTQAGGVAANSIAQWDGTTWSSLGTGAANGVSYPPTKNSYPPLNNVYALAVRGSILYVGGEFTLAGGMPVAHLAVWDGTHWSSLVTNTSNGSFLRVNALAVSGGTVYVGGNFTTVGGTPATYIAQWDGTNWRSLGTDLANGVDGRIAAVALTANGLYLGGEFHRAGDIGANYIARYIPAGAQLAALAQASELVLLPNPTYGAATLLGAGAGTLVQVFDVLGRVAATATADAEGTTLLPAGLVPGVYLVRAGAAATRLVVQ